MASLTVRSLHDAIGGPVGIKTTLTATLMSGEFTPATRTVGSTVIFASSIKTQLPIDQSLTLAFGIQPAGTYWALRIIAVGLYEAMTYYRNFVFPTDAVYDIQSTTEINPDTYVPITTIPNAQAQLDAMQYQLNHFVPAIIALNIGQAVPAGTPSGTIIVRAT
jgi:hypothetical protein